MNTAFTFWELAGAFFFLVGGLIPLAKELPKQKKTTPSPAPKRTKPTKRKAKQAKKSNPKKVKKAKAKGWYVAPPFTPEQHVWYAKYRDFVGGGLD